MKKQNKIINALIISALVLTIAVLVVAQTNEELEAELVDANYSWLINYSVGDLEEIIWGI